MLPERKRPPHLPPLQFHNRPQIQFITICTEKRVPVLTSEGMHECLREIWSKADYWLVGRYVLMPDHLHLFCAPGRVDYPLRNWVAFWKREAAIRWQRSGATAVQKSLFQRDYFDRQLRSHENYDAAWEYVRQNPVKAGLVSDPDEWSYQGELNTLYW